PRPERGGEREKAAGLQRLAPDLQQDEARDRPRREVPVGAGEKRLRRRRFGRVTFARTRFRNDGGRGSERLPRRASGGATGLALPPGPGIASRFSGRKSGCDRPQRIAVEERGQ